MSDIQTILNIIVIALVVIIFALIAWVVVIYLKSKNIASSQENGNKAENTKKVANASKTKGKEDSKQSVFNFMEFDKVEDNMISQDKDSRYLMLVECQGVNYDLMSNVEKAAVEDGFVQFLNTLRYKIQIYIQTRKVNLEGNIARYENKVSEVEHELRQEEFKYQEMIESNQYTQEELDAELYELTKKRNLYEYGRDIIANTESMSLNKKILTKNYYIIIPYYVSELGDTKFDKEEIKNIAFSELYTRAQSMIRMLSSCEIKAHVMNSREIIELLYAAYNRDESEIYGINKYIEAGYESMYSTAPEVLEKRMRALDEEIRNKAITKAEQKISEVELRKRRELRRKERLMDASIDELALLILEDNKDVVGEEIVDEAKTEIKKDIVKRRKKEGEMRNASTKKTTTRTRRQ